MIKPVAPGLGEEGQALLQRHFLPARPAAAAAPGGGGGGWKEGVSAHEADGSGAAGEFWRKGSKGGRGARARGRAQGRKGGKSGGGGG